MELSQFTAPLAWLLADLAVGVIIILTYHLVPTAYQLSLRNIRWVLIPYVALLQGGVSPRLMGLTGINWLTSFGLGLGLIVTIAVCLVLIRSITDFAAPETVSLMADISGRSRSSAQKLTQSSLTLAPLFYAGAEEFHWAFLRGVLAESQQSTPTGLEQPAYWAIWLAALLAVPAIFRFQTTLLARLFKMLLLLLTTILFIYTQNFWLCWMLHALVLLLLIP